MDDGCTHVIAAVPLPIQHHPQIAGKRPAPHHALAQRQEHQWTLDTSSSESESGSSDDHPGSDDDTIVPNTITTSDVANAVPLGDQPACDRTTSPVPWSPTMHRRSSSPVQPPAPPMRPRTRRAAAVYVAPRESQPLPPPSASAVLLPVHVTEPMEHPCAAAVSSPVMPPQTKRQRTAMRHQADKPRTYTKDLKVDDQQKVHMLYIVHVFKETSSIQRACGWCDGCRAPPCGNCDACIYNQAPARTQAKLVHKRCRALTCRLVTQRSLVPTTVDAGRYGRFSLELQPLLHEIVNTEKKRMRWAKAACKHKLSERGCITRQLRDLAERQLEVTLLSFRPQLEHLSVASAKLVHAFLDLRKRKYIE